MIPKQMLSNLPKITELINSTAGSSLAMGGEQAPNQFLLYNIPRNDLGPFANQGCRVMFEMLSGCLFLL